MTELNAESRMPDCMICLGPCASNTPDRQTNKPCECRPTLHKRCLASWNAVTAGECVICRDKPYKKNNDILAPPQQPEQVLTHTTGILLLLILMIVIFVILFYTTAESHWHAEL
jgi:hypothetical protein